MLHPFIIEQIRRREEEKRRNNEAQQPRLELPLEIHRPVVDAEEDDEADRGVAILDIG